MAKSGKKHRAIVSQVPKGKVFLVKDALEKLKNLAYAKFDESIDAVSYTHLDVYKRQYSGCADACLVTYKTNLGSIGQIQCR